MRPRHACLGKQATREITKRDASALVKLFVVEAHSGRVRRAISEARLITTHAIAYVEACATFARVAHARGDGALFPALRRNLDIQRSASPSGAETNRLSGETLQVENADGRSLVMVRMLHQFP